MFRKKESYSNHIYLHLSYQYLAWNHVYVLYIYADPLCPDPEIHPISWFPK